MMEGKPLGDRKLIIATRKSRLAMWQSEHVANRLRRAGREVELLPLSTRGDEVLDRSLAEIGGKGLFLKELEIALLEGRADVAVHSLKDVPAGQQQGLKLSAFLPRANPADLLITAAGTPIAELPEGSRVGSSSLRRISQLKALRPDLNVVPLRGNVETRLAAVREGRIEATLLAAAGLERLGIVSLGAIELDLESWLPAPGQGIIVAQCRSDDLEVDAILAGLGCPTATRQAHAEREIARLFGADCTMPLAAFARVRGDQMRLRARLGDGEGTLIEATAEGAVADAAALGRQVFEELSDIKHKNILDNIGLSHK